MSINSTTSGFLAPIAAPEYDDALDDLLQAAVVGIVGLPGKFVRPRWQPNPPNQPPFTTDWCAFGVTRTEVDAFAYSAHDPANDGTSSVDRDELLYVLHSFYGPNCGSNSERFRDGFEISQNRDTLAASGIQLVEVGEAVTLPALLQEKWVKRRDVTVTYRRRTSRVYQINTILTGQLGLDNEHYVTPITVPNP